MATEVSTRARHNGRTIARLARQVELATAEVDLTLSQYRVLATLDVGCEAASKLADKLAVSRPSITGVVDGLVTRGLVQRSQAGPDRRRVQLDLTPAGRDILIAADAVIEQRLDRIDELIGDLRP
jgi:long-chain acyl-CoA synthetase